MKKIIIEDPIIYKINNFLNPSECKEIIAYSKQLFKKSRTTRTDYNDQDYRKSRSCDILKDSNKVIDKLFGKIESLNPRIQIKYGQITEYKTGEKYKPHYDAYSQDYLSLNKIRQRKITYMIYLNEDFIGGYTRFPNININIKPKEGMLVSFQNCIGNSNYIHPFALHESLEVIQGKKYILTIWPSLT